MELALKVSKKRCMVSMDSQAIQYVTVHWGDPPTVGDGKYTDNFRLGLKLELIIGMDCL